MKLSELKESLYEKKKLLKKKYLNINYIKRCVYWRRRLFHPFSSKVYIIGCPEFSNLGDNAILISEIEYLKKNDVPIQNIECISEHEFLEDGEIIGWWIRKNDLICGLGGGNMGNLYRSEEQIRRMMLRIFPHNPIIIFPQTICYMGDNKERDENRSIEYYNTHKKLVLVAREEESWKKMKSLYPNIEILLTPDIVLSSSMETYGISSKERRGVLFCVRNDGEKMIDDSIWNELKYIVECQGLEHRYTDMYSDCAITKANREDCIKSKMEEFCESELVFTDRLHGMVFAALTGTPCIVFSNNNHKVEGTYKWISYLPYIKYVKTIQEAEKVIPELIKMKNCKYDNKPLMAYYASIENVIKRKTGF